MPIPYRKRKEYFRHYYQISKGVKSVKNRVLKSGVKINTQRCPHCPELKHELKVTQKAYENLRQQLDHEQEQKRAYWRQQKQKLKARQAAKQKPAPS